MCALPFRWRMCMYHLHKRELHSYRVGRGGRAPESPRCARISASARAPAARASGFSAAVRAVSR